ncbi:amidohydrolase family protein [Dyella sp. 20L07]|uniref:amidohydrolase family protein n=1 Tax=Dyella sp. 20L07 TaxID=3384240 RepID=UPI003D2BC859
MRAPLVVFALCLALPCFADAPATTEALVTPPANAQYFTILSTAGKHGSSARWIAADGTHMGRESLLLRGMVTEVDSSATTDKDGMLEHVVIRGHTPTGDAAETFSITSGTARWKSPVDAGSAPYHAPAEYVAFGGPMALFADVFEQLLAAPGHSLALLPGGSAHAERLTTATVGEGAAKKQVTAYAVTGVSNTLIPMWADESGHFFGFVQGMAWLPAGYESAMPVLQKAQADAMALHAKAIVPALLKTPSGPVAFTHVRAFVDGTRFVDEQTVLVDKGVITQVGPVASIKLPPHAQVIDGTGKTLVPGLWDSHQHVADDTSGPMLLSLGITSVRDPGNINEETLLRAARRARGELLGPHVYPSMLIDGKGPNTAQSASVATSQEEAIALVDKAKAEGFVAIKIYGSFNPAWVKATAAEAHKLGLHVHGHLPAGMRPEEAIADGYDEITHIYFVMMQAMPDSVVKVSNGMGRFDGPGRYAKDVDLNKEPMKSLIATMAERKITSDPTLVVAEILYFPESGDLSPAYAPFMGTLPPAVERGFRQGGFTLPKDLTRADYRASFAKLQALVGAMHKAGVPIVAGTDGSGLELVRELELYVQAGFTNAEALASATLAAAHLVGADQHTGSIQVGKAADLVLVDGNPAVNISDLRHTEVVMMDGKLMDANALRTEGGISRRPAYAE